MLAIPQQCSFGTLDLFLLEFGDFAAKQNVVLLPAFCNTKHRQVAAHCMWKEHFSNNFQRQSTHIFAFPSFYCIKERHLI